MFLLIDITVECVLTYRYNSRMCSYLYNSRILIDITVECVLTYRYNSRMCSYL